MHRLTVRILEVGNEFQNKTFPICERVCVSPPPYYLYWFEISYPDVIFNLCYGPFCIKCINGIQETKPYGRQWNLLLDAVGTILKYNKYIIDHAIYIKFFSDVTVSYLIVSTDDVLNNINNETEFPELTRVI